MQLQVEKDVVPSPPQNLHQPVASRVVQLHPHLQPLAGPLQSIHKVKRLSRRREVQSHRQPILRVYRSSTHTTARSIRHRMHTISLEQFQVTILKNWSLSKSPTKPCQAPNQAISLIPNNIPVADYLA